MSSGKHFEEIHVVDGIAERTGKTIDRATARGSDAVCRSLAELTRKYRSQGDGYFYLPVAVWPEDATTVPLTKAWTTLG